MVELDGLVEVVVGNQAPYHGVVEIHVGLVGLAEDELGVASSVS